MRRVRITSAEGRPVNLRAAAGTPCAEEGLSVERNKTDRREAIKVIGGLIVIGAGLAPLAASAHRAVPGKKFKDLNPSTDVAGGPPPGAPLAPPPTVKLNRIPGPAQEAEVASLLGPLAAGDLLGQATLVAVHGVRLGAAAITLKLSNGDTIQVDICQHDGSPRALEPVAATSRYDLFLANGSRGHERTGLKLNQVVQQLAQVIRTNEARVPRLNLLPLRERLRRYPRGRFDASL